MRKNEYPGALTPAQWRALPRTRRYDLVRRAQCDFLGSFRTCSNKTCRRLRTCSSDNPNACAERLWRLTKKKPKTLRDEFARIGALADG